MPACRSPRRRSPTCRPWPGRRRRKGRVAPGPEARRDPAQGRHRRQGETGRADTRAAPGCGAAGAEGRHHAGTRAARQAGEPPKPQQAAPQPQAAPPLAAPAPSGQACGAHQATGGASAWTAAGQACRATQPQAAPPLPQPQQAKPAEPPKPQAAPPCAGAAAGKTCRAAKAGRRRRRQHPRLTAASAGEAEPPSSRRRPRRRLSRTAAAATGRPRG